MDSNFSGKFNKEEAGHAFRSLTAYEKAVNTAAIVSITDKTGKIVFANNLFCEISKYTRKELLGSTHRIINSGFHNGGFFKELWEVISSGQIWHGEIKNRAKDGSCYWVDTTISPIFDSEGKVHLYLSIRSLITDRKNLEQDREKLIIELTHKYNELMQFNYIVSHNLRAPIANMMGLVDLLRDECDGYNKVAENLIKFLSDSLISVDSIIRDLTEILSARDPINQRIEQINLPEIIKSVQSNLEKQIRESGTKFKINIAEKAVHFDSIRSYIQSVIYNIISNAIKYAKDGVNPIISLSANKVNDHLTIEISDNGIGMDMTKISSQLFGLYKKFNFSKEGRGLGLHMTKTQIESLGGSIEVKSRVGEGSTFTISLPA